MFDIIYYNNKMYIQKTPISKNTILSRQENSIILYKSGQRFLNAFLPNVNMGLQRYKKKSKNNQGH